LGELAYDRSGAGEPVLLLHGLGSARGCWKPVIELAKAERELVAVDLPGFGESPVDGAGMALSVSDHADRIERFMDEQALERPHVAGNSLGGAIALELARRGAVRSVTAFSPIGFWHRPGQAWCRGALRAGYRASRLTPERRQSLTLTRLSLFIYAFGRPFQTPAEEVWATSRRGTSAPGFLDGITYGLEYRFAEPQGLRGVPLTIAWGRRDVLLPYWSQARRARRALPWARHVTLPGCGHVPFYDDRELCTRVVLEGSA
jgi:pimeloyl-ACP methyl ester carboxylesterase